jgi:hypothetical protein
MARPKMRRDSLVVDHEPPAFALALIVCVEASSSCRRSKSNNIV